MAQRCDSGRQARPRVQQKHAEAFAEVIAALR